MTALVAGKACFESWGRPEPRAPNEFHCTSQLCGSDWMSARGGSLPQARLEMASARNSGWTCTLNLRQSCRRSAAVKSQIEVCRDKAKEYARRTILTKSLRESRRYRKLADMYWALALNEEPETVRPSKMIVKTSPT
jgi:hypothetical protein